MSTAQGKFKELEYINKKIAGGHFSYQSTLAI